MNLAISWGPNMINRAIVTNKVSWVEIQTNGLLVAKETFELIMLLTSINGVCLLHPLLVVVLGAEINVGHPNNIG